MLKSWSLVFILLVTMLFVGCWTKQEKQPIRVEEKEVAKKSAEIGKPAEKVVEKVETKEEKKEEPKKGERAEEKQEVKTEDSKKTVCDKDICIGNVLQKCLLKKALYNITCSDMCKDGKCVSKEVTEEEFVFSDLPIGKTLGSRKQVLVENDMKALTTTRTNTANGITDVKYLLRFGGDVDDKIEAGEVYYGKDRTSRIGDYLKYVQGDDILEYVVDFSRGWESKVSANNKLDDLLGAKISFFGVHYQLVNAETDSAQKAVFLKFLRGTTVALLEEGASQSFPQDNKEYEVVATLIDGKNNKVRMTVNGKISPDLKIGDVFNVDNSFIIAIKDILFNNVGGTEKGIVEFFIGADQLEFIDNDATNNQFERNVRVNGLPVERGRAMIRATSRSDVMRIDLLKYRLEAKGTENDVYMPPQGDLRKQSAEPASLLTKNWNIIYEGFSNEKGDIVTIKHRNARMLELSFINNGGKSYTIPLIDSTNAFKFGDDNQDLLFVEDSNGNIKRDDYFVVTDSNNEKGITQIYQLLQVDKDNKKIQVKDLAGSTRDATYTVDASGFGTGSFSVTGKNYNFIVPVNGSAIGVDLNGNGNVGNDKVMIVASGGLLLNLGTTQDISGKTSQDITLTTVANKLKDGSSNEDVKVTISKGNEINLQVPDQRTLHLETVGDTLKGMTSYGALYEVSGSTRSDLKVTYPAQQKLATVKLKFS